MDGEPTSEMSPKPVSDWVILRREWSDLVKSPMYGLFSEIADDLGEAGLARLQPPYLFSSSPEGLEKEMDRTLQKIDPDNPLNKLRNSITAPYSQEITGRNFPHVVLVLKYNQSPDGYEHDELYLMSGKEGKDSYLEFGHRRIKRKADGGNAWTNVNWIATDEEVPDRQNLIEKIKEIFEDSPVYTPTGEEFKPLIIR